MLNKIPSLIKPTIQTKFRVDFDWWKSQDRNWRNSLLSFLCEEHQKKYAGLTDDVQVDIVSNDTGAVKQGDGILYSLANHCARQPGFLSTDAPLVDTLFKVFVTNDNKPLSSEELSKIVGKPAETILKTIGGFNVYKGIRPAS